ncbi:hypothetical protein NUU61_008551 [Penicillium alfredii]|uniref:Fungal-specific transcription factor domain-containing protein n=1 Tax=Penicillium alfredii TaxID=1506179 RepID=A0A9W9JWT6_9EURO|nr:uncharacterized protein NUU61_008551 [Penicillium alfredii]KAJ5083972.1 hypothetical protein NUU61_008551 [Penicillium alfredii]
MHVFSTQTAPMLFPAAPDFFLQRIISAALDTPHLLYALLAAACSHHSRLVRDKSLESQTMCLMFTNRAISSLRAALCEDQEAIKPETVTAAMALCTNDVCNGNMPVWRTHLRGVLRLLTALVDRQKEPGLGDPFTQALLKWFTTLDLLAGLSGLRAECVHDARDGMLGQLWKGAEGRVDDICGYSLDLVPILGRASQLIHQQHLNPLVGYESNIHDSEERQQVTREAETLEKQILSLLDNTTPDSILDHSNHLRTELQYTNRAFAYSALLHLHRRVQQLQQNHPKVRAEIIGILDAVANIRPFSSANILILWPIFSAGCETEAQSERELIQTRMGNMQSLGMGNFSRARKLLYQFWQSGSSLPWDIYFARLGLELVLF